MAAWLITWEWMGNHAKVDNEVAAILNYRFSGEKVRQIVDLSYVNSQYSLRERIAYAKNKQDNPYPAQFHRLGGVPWLGRIHCGHNPYLYARLVDNLCVNVNNEGEEELTWKERYAPDKYAGVK